MMMNPFNVMIVLCLIFAIGVFTGIAIANAGERLSPSQIADNVEYYAFYDTESPFHRYVTDSMTIGEAKEFYAYYKTGSGQSRHLLESMASQICYNQVIWNESKLEGIEWQ